VPDSGTAILNVNGSQIEIPSTANYLHDFHLFLDASVAELIVDAVTPSPHAFIGSGMDPCTSNSATDMSL
jgi:hypothetical protein